MRYRSMVVGFVAILGLVGCSAVGSDILSHLETTSTRTLVNEAPPRFDNLGQTSVEVICGRVNKTTLDCYAVPVTGRVDSCTRYAVQSTGGISFQRILTGKMNNAAVVGTVPGAQCPRRQPKPTCTGLCVELDF